MGTPNDAKTLQGPTGLARFIPIVDWLPHYQRSFLRGDLIAGLSVWALMVPNALGYATISGVPVQYGLYAAGAGLIAFAIFTTSRQVTQGPSSSSAAVLGAAVLATATQGSDEAIAMATAIVLVAGALYLVMYLFKMGWISDFLSASVLTGFTFGVAINVATGELFKITGTESSGSNTWEKMWAWLTSLPDANGAAVVVGIVALLVVFGLAIYTPKVPGALVAVILGILAARMFGLADRGVDLIGDVPQGLPNLMMPDIGYIIDNFSEIIGAAIGLILIGFSVTIATVRAYATKHNYSVDLNQELMAQGMSNVASGLVQGVFVNGSLSKTPVADEAGAKTQMYNLFQAFLIILTLVFLAPFFSDLPDAVLGAIIIQAMVMGVMNVPAMKRLWSIKPIEFVMAMAALLGVLTFGILQGVVIGVVLSLMWLVAVSSRPHIPQLGRKPGTEAYRNLESYPNGETYPGLMILRFDDGLFFVNSGALGDRIRDIRVDDSSELSGLVLSMEGVDFMDIEGADALKKVANSGKDRGIDVHLARVKDRVLAILQRDGVVDVIGTDHIHADIEEAVDMHMKLHPPTNPTPKAKETKKAEETSNDG